MLGGEEPRARRHLALGRNEAHCHKTEAVYRRYAIVTESDLPEAGTKFAAMLGTTPEMASSMTIPVTIRR